MRTRGGSADVEAGGAGGLSAEWPWCGGAVMLEWLVLVSLFLAAPREWLVDDNRIATYPVYHEMGRQLRNGSFPLLSDHSWQAAGIAGEYGAACFHPPTLLFAALVSTAALPPEWLSLIWIALWYGVLLTGVYVLARSLAAPPPLAAYAALAAGASGYLLGLAPAWWIVLHSAAWLPWYWWTLRQACLAETWRPRLGWTAAAGLVLALVITAGWNFADFAALVIHAHVAAEAVLRTRSARPLGPAIAAGLSGLCLSAPAWMTHLEYARWSYRAIAKIDLSTPNGAWLGPLDWLGLVVPFADWRGSLVAGPLLGVGTIPLLVVAAAVLLDRGVVRRHAGLFLLAAVAAVLCGLPDVPPLRWMFRFHPLLGLVLAILSATVLPAVLEQLGRRDAAVRRAVAWCAIACGVALVAGALVPHRRPLGVAPVIAWGALVTAAGWLGLAGDRRQAAPMLGVLALAVTASARLLYGQPWGAVFEAPRTARDRGCAVQPNWYLCNYDQATYLGRQRLSAFMPGNMAMESGLRTVNGYSNMLPCGPLLVFGITNQGFVFDSRRPCAGASDGRGLLARMAVDGLILRDDVAVEDPVIADFARACDLDGFQVWHRRGGGSPRVQAHKAAHQVDSLEAAVTALKAGASTEPVIERSAKRSVAKAVAEPAAAATVPATDDWGPGAPRSVAFDRPRALEPVAESPAAVVVDVDVPAAGGPALVSFARPWLPGYRATLDGEPLDVLRMDALMPAVVVPAGGRGRLELRYFPESLRRGLVIAVAAAAVHMAVAAALVATAWYPRPT